MMGRGLIGQKLAQQLKADKEKAEADEAPSKVQSPKAPSPAEASNTPSPKSEQPVLPLSQPKPGRLFHC